MQDDKRDWFPNLVRTSDLEPPGGNCGIQIGGGEARSAMQLSQQGKKEGFGVTATTYVLCDFGQLSKCCEVNVFTKGCKTASKPYTSVSFTSVLCLPQTVPAVVCGVSPEGCVCVCVCTHGLVSGYNLGSVHLSS